MEAFRNSLYKSKFLKKFTLEKNGEKIRTLASVKLTLHTAH